MLHHTLITNNGTMTTLLPETSPDLEPNDAKKVVVSLRPASLHLTLAEPTNLGLF